MKSSLRSQLLAEKSRIGMTNAELARALKVSPPTVCKMLSDKNDMSITTAERIAAAMKVELRLARIG